MGGGVWRTVQRLLALLLLCFHMNKVGLVMVSSKFMHEYRVKLPKYPLGPTIWISESIVLIGTINGHVFIGFAQGHLGQFSVHM